MPPREFRTQPATDACAVCEAKPANHTVDGRDLCDNCAESARDDDGDGDGGAA